MSESFLVGRYKLHCKISKLAKLMTSLRDGVLVTRLDRLGSSVRELLNLLAQLDKQGVGFRSLADSWCDTPRTRGSCSPCWEAWPEFERELIKARTGKGRRRAMANGGRFGRKPEWRRQRRRQIPPADATPKRRITRLTI